MSNNGPLVSFAELLKRIAQQLPVPPWEAQELNQDKPKFKGIKETPPPKPEPPERPKLGPY